MPHATLKRDWSSHLLALACALLTLGLGASSTYAQNYPVRPIRILVPYPPGGANDILARLVGEKLSANWGQAVIVDNRPGGNTVIATDLTAKASPDGHTMILTSSTHPVLPSLYAKLPFDPIRDFEAVAVLATASAILLVHPSVPVNSVKELIAWAKARPGKVNYGSSGFSGSGHLAMEMLKSKAGLDMTHIPYKGMAPALTELMGGQVVLMFGNLVASLPHVKSGKLRALAVTSLKRSPAMPELPTVAESGLPDFEVTVWLGLIGPAGIPKPVVAKLNLETARIVQSADTRERLAALGFDSLIATPEQYMAMIKSDVVKWGRVVRDANIKLE